MSDMTEKEIIEKISILDSQIKSLKSEFERIKTNLINIESELIGLYVNRSKLLEKQRILMNKKGNIVK